jgi:hypothetical protein
MSSKSSSLGTPRLLATPLALERLIQDVSDDLVRRVVSFVVPRDMLASGVEAGVCGRTTEWSWTMPSGDPPGGEWGGEGGREVR